MLDPAAGDSGSGLALRRPEDGETEKIFTHFFSHSNLFSAIPHDFWCPPTDVYETEDRYVVLMEIPGLRNVEADVAIELNHNVLTVRGARRIATDDRILRFHQMEIHRGYFEKSVTLPHSINPEVRQGQYRDGFLEITVEKSSPKGSTRRRIEIES